MSDYAHRATDAALADLEKRIAKVYSDASNEMQDTVRDYFAQFAARDREQARAVKAGEITTQEYRQWRLTQLSRGEKYRAMQSSLAERFVEADEVAVSYVNDATPGIYSLNRNYSAYTIEQAGADVSFTLYDESAVRRLIKEQPNLMPHYPEARAVRRGIDLAYGKRQITASITGGILQGKDIYKIADDLMSRISTMSEDSAVRTARTAFTAAENAGRQDSYEAAEEMGIPLQKRWVATLDDRTRESHIEADGQTVGVDENFKVGDDELEYPGDPGGEPCEIYNCRCTVIAVVGGADTSDAERWSRDPNTGERMLVSDMNYNEWYEWRTKSEDVTEEYLNNAIAGSGTISFDDGYRRSGHSGEIYMANWIHDNFGGDITLLAESKNRSQETADFLWNGSLWDLKNVSTEKSVDRALRKGIHQIADNAGGVILNCATSISDRTEANIVHRARRSSSKNVDVMILKNNELEKIIECKK